MKAPILAAAVLAVSAAASAQTQYTLQNSSSMHREFCLPPCLCPGYQAQGPVSGAFTLTFLDSDPLYTRYALTDIAWQAHIPETPTAMSGSGIYTIGGHLVPVHRLQLDLTIGPLTVITSFDSGFVPIDPQHAFPAISITTIAEPVCRRETLTLLAAPGSSCYANCDGSSTQPILNIADFTCFLHRFAAGESYANCDGSTIPPVLNVADFACFLQQFASGCP